MSYDDPLETTSRSIMLSHRDDTIRALRETLVTLTLSPSLKVSDSLLASLNEMLSAWESFAKALHTGTAGYWEKDLSDGPRRQYQQAKHALRILWALYGPQPEPTR